MLALVQQWAWDRDYRIAFADISVIHEVRSELKRRRTAGELQTDFATRRLSFFRYQTGERITNPQTVIMVAVRRPAHRLRFETWNGPFDVILPPTYVRYSPLFDEIADDLGTQIPTLQGHLEILLAPLKAVACKIGLTVYGRNNVTYIPEWGSYFQLLGYLCDLDFGATGERVAETAQGMPECDGCGVCASVCPTGAIGDDRMLLHAERCATLFSEEPGDLADIGRLPGRCLFGCLECQEICPANAGLLHIESAAVAFNRQETEAILAGKADQNIALAETIRQKLDALGLTEEPLIRRNLNFLLATEKV